MNASSIRRILGFFAICVFAAAAIHAQSVATRQLRPAVRSGQAQFVSRMDQRQTLRLDLVLPLSDPAGLTQFLSDVYNPASPSYRHFLTPQEFTARFGPTQDQYDAVLRFAGNYGLKVVGGSRDGMDVQIEAPVAAIETALHVSMRVYQHPTQDRTFFSPDSEPQLDLPFNLWHISGLDNYSLPHPLYLKKSDGIAAHPASTAFVQRQATTGSGPSASYLGSDMRAAYYGSGNLTGAGQNLGLFEFAGTNLADVTTYYHNAGQTNSVPLSQISVDGTSTTCNHSSGCDDTEQTLDITQALGMAPGLSSLVIYVGSYDTTLLAAMTTHSPLPMTIGCSWGWTPTDPSSLDPYFQKMAAQGQTFLAASGDSSTWSASNPAWPADDAYVVSVGGTDLVTASAGGAWQSETAWADSGGGISSTQTAIPSWQQFTGVITAGNHGSTTYRNGPDVSANANFTFYVCANQGTCTANQYGGTSFAAPMWAGYLALVNQQLASASKSPVGFINPTIYAQNITSAYATNFHDIASGTSGSYSALAGYDLVTGWGSPNAGLIAALAGPAPVVPGFSIATSAASLSLAQGAKGTLTASISVTGGFKSAVALTATGQPTGVTVAFSPTSLTGAGSSTLTITAASTAAIGSYTITVKATSGSTIHTTTVALTIAAPPSFTFAASSASMSLAQGATGTATLTTTAANGFNSAVALSASGAPSGVTAGFSPASITGAGTSTLSLKVASTVAVGNYVITLTGTSGGVAHTAKIALAVTIAPGFSITASPTSISLAQGASGSASVSTAVVGGFNAAIAFTASGAPAGVTLAFSPTSVTGANTSTLSISVGSSVAVGTYTVTVTGTSGSIVHTAKIALVVTIAPGFSIAISPATLSLAQGASSHFVLTSTAVGGFHSAIALTASGQPAGVTLTFSPSSLNGAGSSTVTVAAGASVATGSYPITLTATSGSVVHTARLTLTVTIAPGFSLTASSATVSVVQGGSGHVTVSTAVVGGFKSAVSFSATGAPSGVTASFSPASVTGAGTSTLTFAVSTSATPGAYPITVKATSGSLVKTVAVTLTVTPIPPAFAIKASAASIIVARGHTANVTITATTTGAFTAAIAFSVSGQGTGNTATFTPASITGAGTSSLQIAVASTSATGSFTVSVSGKSGSVTHAVTIPLTVTK